MHVFFASDALTCGPCQGRDNAKEETRRGEGTVETASVTADDVWSMVNLAAVYFDCCASGARITM